MWCSFEDARKQPRRKRLQFAQRLFDAIAAELAEQGCDDFVEELRGVAELVGVHASEMLLMHLSYESLMGCTAALIADELGCFGLLRTLDWDIIPLRRLVVRLNVVRGGRTLFQATGFRGFCGVLTGMRSGAYAVAVNWRSGGDDKDNDDDDDDDRPMTWPISFFVRHALQNAADSFERFVALACSTAFMAPCYLVCAGAEAGQGVVISKDENTAVCAEPRRADTAAVCVQANMDHGVVDRAADTTDSLRRCAFAQRHLRPAMNVDEALRVFLCPPICEEDTLYLTYMQPSTAAHRDCCPVFSSTKKARPRKK